MALSWDRLVNAWGRFLGHRLKWQRDPAGDDQFFKAGLGAKRGSGSEALHRGFLALFAAGNVVCARADSVVVFNEIMYHPSGTNEAALEWIELENQMGVDVDLSGWRLDQAVHWTFPEGTVLGRGGLLVVAASPETLAAAGVSNVFGPWLGRLGNGGDTLQLRNNNDRLMDEVNYGTEGDWPVAPDGAGPSLARRVTQRDSADPQNWQASAQSGGTPGTENFPEAIPTLVTTALLPMGATWKYNNTGHDLGSAWRAPEFDDSAWSEAPAVFYHTKAALPAPKQTPLAPVHSTAYFRSRFVFPGGAGGRQLQLRPLVDDGAVVYLNGVELARINLPAGGITFTTQASGYVGDAAFGDPIRLAADGLRVGTNYLAVEVHQAAALGAGYPQAVLDSGPIAYWRLGETVNPALDTASAVGSPQVGAQNGVFNGLLPVNLGQAGPRASDLAGGRALAGFEADNRAPRFAGNREGGDDVVVVSDPWMFDFAANRRFTLEAWVNGLAAQEDGAPIVCKGTGGGGEQYCVDVSSGTYRFYVWSGGSPNTPTLAHSGVSPNGLWQHIVAVFDPFPGRMRLYVDGVEAASAPTPATIVNTTHDLTLGARQLSSGPYDLNFDGRIDEVAIFDRALTSTEILAHYNAAFMGRPGSGADTNDVVFGLQVDALETVVPGSQELPLAFNELASSTNSAFWFELINLGSTNLNLAGCRVARLGGSTDREYIFPARTLIPGGCLPVAKSDLGFGVDAGDRLVLYGPGSSKVLDAVVAKKAQRARFPDGTGEWLISDQPTPGAANLFSFRDELVINEIMYRPAATNTPWIEILNRSSNTVDLTGWRLQGRAQYDFPPGLAIPPGACWVVALDVLALQSLHPGVKVLGPLSQALDRTSDRLRLLDPSGNRINEVQYFDGGRWPLYTAGGGSSLELRDPRADNGVAEAWAASDESAKSPWQTYTWRATAKPGQAGEPALWHELALCLVDGPGEVLLDDISVVESPATAPRQLVQNGSFEGGSAAHWRFLGTHRHSRVELEPANPANFVLHLVATGAGEYQGNQLETTFLHNTAIVDGREYQISFRARWLAGQNLLNARLYFNRLARTVRLPTPADGGTPGAANSRWIANLGPTFYRFTHGPIVPNAGQSVTITAEAADPDGVAAVGVKYSVAGGAWQDAPMTERGARGTRHEFTGVVPGQPAGSMVQFYVIATDSLGAVATFPAAGANSRALYVVQDGQATKGPLRNFRLLMTPADAAWLHTGTNTLSNDLLGGTVVTEEQEAYYEVGVRLKGSFVGRNVARVGFHVQFPADHRFRGVHDKVAVDRSQHTLTGGIGEILMKHMAGHAGGIPNMYDDLAWFMAPQPSYTSVAQLRLAGFDELYLDTQYPRGGDGPMHEPEVIRWLVDTVDGQPESPKRVGNEGAGTGYQTFDLQNYGDNPESYRWTFPLLNRRNTDDFSGLMAACKLFSLGSAAFQAQASQILDVDEWLRVLAFQSLVGPSDAYYTGGTYHNYRLYVRPEDGRVLYFPWDWDSAFTISTTTALVGGGNVAKLIKIPAHHRAYLNHLHDLISTTFNTAYMTRWTTHYGAMSGQNLGGILSYIGARGNFVLGQLPRSIPFAITNHGGLGFTAINGYADLAGTAPIALHRLEINGTVYPVNWLSDTQWALAVPLKANLNPFVIRGLDSRGNLIPDAVASLVVTNVGPAPVPPLVINEWMADNKGPGGVIDQPEGQFHDWFELYNPHLNAVNLAGLWLTDNLSAPTQWRIPTNIWISAQGFLLVWADGNTHLNPLLGGTNVDLHANFTLDKDGEAIGLFAADGLTPVATVAFGRQIENVSEGCYPDGDTNAVYSMANFTPRAANSVSAPSAPRLLPALVSGDRLSLQWEAIPGRAYQVETKADLNDPGWFPLGAVVIAIHPITSVIDVEFSPTANRFYRVLLLQ